MLQCVTHTVGCSNVALWHYYRVQDGDFGEEKLEQMFPAIERPICVFQSLFKLTHDGCWLPLSTEHVILFLCAQS